MLKRETILDEKFQGMMAALFLIALVLALYWPVIGYEFITLDDSLYLLENPDIQKGLSLPGISWAMTTFYTANWHPLTWLSLMADYELYGLNAAGYHASNLLLHVLNTLLLFLALRRMTGEIWKCLAVAALFGVHPLNIESVAWIAERKNLLSTFFWILTLLAYVRYVEKAGWLRYLQVLFLSTLGLMAKPMLVTLPLILLLMDYWPLHRLAPANHRSGGEEGEMPHGDTAWRLLKEKIPFFFLSLGSVLITLRAAQAGAAIRTFAELPLSGRVANALITCLSYLEKMVWPVDLAIFYPYPADRPGWLFAAAFFIVAAITVFATLKWKKYPYCVVGWFWYLITLLPVIGIVQVGFQSMANRYVYVPLVGIFIIIAWGGADFLRTRIHHSYLTVAVAALILILSFSTWAQLPHWRNSEMAFSHALRVTRNNFIAHAGMGDVWLYRGELQMARLHYQEALRIQPNYAEARNNLAVILMKEGKVAEAERELREALKHKPSLAEAHSNLGAALICQGRFPEAASHFSKALELKPGSAVAKENLARLVNDGRARLPAGTSIVSKP